MEQIVKCLFCVITEAYNTQCMNLSKNCIIKNIIIEYLLKLALGKETETAFIYLDRCLGDYVQPFYPVHGPDVKHYLALFSLGI